MVSINRRDTDEYRSQVSGLDTPNVGLNKVFDASEPLLSKVSFRCFLDCQLKGPSSFRIFGSNNFVMFGC